MDEKLVDLFRQWLKALEVAQDPTSDDFAHKAVAELEMRIATTPAEGLHGLVVKLGLHNCLSDHAVALLDAGHSDRESSALGAPRMGVGLTGGWPYGTQYPHPMRMRIVSNSRCAPDPDPRSH